MKNGPGTARAPLRLEWGPESLGGQ
jgi:hypothetical protein